MKRHARTLLFVLPLLMALLSLSAYVAPGPMPPGSMPLFPTLPR